MPGGTKFRRVPGGTKFRKVLWLEECKCLEERKFRKDLRGRHVRETPNPPKIPPIADWSNRVCQDKIPTPTWRKLFSTESPTSKIAKFSSFLQALFGQTACGLRLLCLKERGACAEQNQENCERKNRPHRWHLFRFFVLSASIGRA